MLLKYNNSLLKKTDALIKFKSAFVRLSYFNNYNNLVDVPSIGEPYNISCSNSYYLTKGSMVINGITYPTLRLGCTGNTTTGSFDIPITLEKWNIITFDYYCRLYMESSWCEPFTPYTSPCVWADNWGGGRGCGVTIFGYSSSPCRIIYVNSNLRNIYFDGHRVMCNNSIHSDTIFHVAYMFEKNDDEWIKQYTYINGELQAIIDIPYNYFTGNKIYFDTNYYSRCYVEMAQLAIREGDYTINNKENFPVPTEPYIKW